jgi:hypothetical protein
MHVRPMVCALVLASLTVAHHRATGQIVRLSAPLDSGTLVRASFRDGQRATGRLLQPAPVGTQTLLACNYPGRPCLSRSDDSSLVRSLRLADFRELEVQRGNHLVRGAILGALGGALLSAVGLLHSGDCEHNCIRSIVEYEAAFVAGGALLGGAIGSASPAWRPIH